MDRRSVNKLLLTALAPTSALNAYAQTAFPSKTLQILVPYAAGGATDAIARTIADQLAKQSKFPVIVENKPGGSSSIGTGVVGRSAPDGHTLLITTGSTVTLIPHTLQLSFDPVKVLAPVAQVGRTPLFLFAHPSIPVKDLKGLITWMKAHPGRISYGSYGAGTQGHFGGLILSKAAGVEMTHIPFQGGAPALQALIGGHIDLLIDAYLPTMEQVKAGRVLALAASSPERSPYATAVPTFRELGYPALESIGGFFGMFAPAGTSPETVAALHAMVQRAVGSAEFQDRLKLLGFLPPSAMSPAEFEVSIRNENAAWAKFVKEIGFKRGDS